MVEPSPQIPYSKTITAPAADDEPQAQRVLRVPVLLLSNLLCGLACEGFGMT